MKLPEEATIAIGETFALPDVNEQSTRVRTLALDQEDGSTLMLAAAEFETSVGLIAVSVGMRFEKEEKDDGPDQVPGEGQ